MPIQQITVSFADLVHIGHSNVNATPLGIALVASYALDKFDDKIKVNLFKHPAEFSKYLNQIIPNLVCFSNYIWNLNLNYEYARQIKIKSPDTIIVFGGPNYPLETEAQEMFLQSHPDIDFYIFRDGEQPFVELFNILLEHEFNISKVKKARLNIPSCHYISDGKIIRGDLLPPLKAIDEIPSPYLSHLCDKFLDKNYAPLMLTARGCPFNCTFCQDGDEYFKSVRKFSLDRVKSELQYIAQRTSNPNLLFADSNFGMYKYDIEICREIASIQKKYDWPKYFIGLAGKNNKSRVLEAASIIQNSVFGGDSVYLNVAVQSTDEQVLKNIKRHNVSLSSYFDIAKMANTHGLNTFSEVILCLPGDTKDAHLKSIFQLIDAEMNVVRPHQLIMLQGAEISMKKSREKYDMLTRFRVMPKTIDSYQAFGKIFNTPEIDEICVSNSSMSFDDYLECRMFDLSVEVFYNNGIFRELINFLKLHQISISSFIMNIHKKVRFTKNPLSDLYDNFLRETKELWNSKEELEMSLQQPGIIDRHTSGKLGNNEQLMYRSLIIFRHMDASHKIAFNIANELLKEKGHLNKRIRDYLEELAEFSLLRKKDMFSVEKTMKRIFHYDFVNLETYNFNGNPLSSYKPKGINIAFTHTNDQRELIKKYMKIYGLSNYGIGNILSNASNVNILYRTAKHDPGN